ncbi:hypothetical protein C3L33_18026, partial [Rhododendron williamsianum]
MGTAQEEEHPVKAFGWATTDPSGVLSPFKFSRRATGDEDVRHEITGVVTEVGSKVQKYKVGDRVGVGCLVGACHTCDNCENNVENYCPQQIQTYNSQNTDGTMTYGGYSDHMVSNERYIVRIPDNLPLDAAAPLLCAGITTYSPLRYFGLDKPGFRDNVTVISTSPRKKQEAIEVLGADSFLVSTNPEEMQAAMGTLDGIIDTVSAAHALVPLLFLLKNNGKIVMVGDREATRVTGLPFDYRRQILILEYLIAGRRMVAGSCIGGLKETQEMIDFAGKHNITPQIEVVPMDYVNTAMERLAKGDVKYRFVLDVANTLKAT